MCSKPSLTAAQQPRNSRAAVRATANATTYKQLVGFLAVSFNYDIQKL